MVTGILAAVIGFFSSLPKIIAGISAIVAAITSCIAAWAIKSKSAAVDAAAQKAKATKDTSALENTFGGGS